ncbi:MAG: 2-C-methyl-D-erythritol 4-phosphate cytidylyltransferase [Lachnospiraceae bacterium]|nr:2-C-methyl-D-erythritol 4-phosphate cytidylyltransferase [Lachnospiraceae bacterium]
MKGISAIILAAGKGSRMGADRPKQFIEAGGKPLIAYCLIAFEKSPVDQIVLVSGRQYMDLCSQIVERYHISKCRSITVGGACRAASVLNGINASEGDIVLIHDGARPLISQRLIADTIDAVKKYRSVVPVIPVKDTIRMLAPDGELLPALDRSRLFGMQTPQAFFRDDILNAYASLESKGYDLAEITDDVMVMEKGAGIKAHPLAGDEYNRKITTPSDMDWLSLHIGRKHRDEDER